MTYLWKDERCHHSEKGLEKVMHINGISHCMLGERSSICWENMWILG